MAFPAQIVTRRWIYPCQGAEFITLPPTATTTSSTTPTTTSGLSIISGFLSTTSGSSSAALDADLAYSFHAISTKATRLKRHVRELKDLYVRTPLYLHNLC